MASQKFDEFRYLKSQVACPGEINNDDNLPRTFSRFLDNQLDRRERLRTHLWQNRNSTRAQDSLDRVSVVCQSLVESLLQCSSENRIMPYCTFLEIKNNDAHLKNKMQFDWFVRVAAASEEATVYTCHHLEVAQKFAPQLRSVAFRQEEYDEVYDVSADIPKVSFNAKLREFVINELQADDGFLALISLNGSQLESLVLVDFEIFSACASLSDTRIPMMPRLKKLKLAIYSMVYSDYKPIQMGPHLERVIPWSQLTTFLVGFYFVELDDIYQCGILLDLFGHMAQLHRLSFCLCYDIHDNFNRINADRLNELCTFMVSKTNQIQEFTNLEIFSFYAHFYKNNQHEEVAKMYPDYRFFLDQFSPKLGTKLRKLIFKFPGDLASTDYCLAMDFSQPFCQLETLVLNFAALFSKTPELNQLRGFINNQDDGPIRSQTIRQLTIKNLECYYPLLLNQIPDVFPNLVELKIGFALTKIRIFPRVPQFPDQDLMQIIDRLPQLRSLRFTDDIAKAKDLYGSIDLMCKRAMDLKPRNPMQFRIPLDAEFMLKFNQLPDAEKAELCWIKAAKWIQVY